MRATLALGLWRRTLALTTAFSFARGSFLFRSTLRSGALSEEVQRRLQRGQNPEAATKPGLHAPGNQSGCSVHPATGATGDSFEVLEKPPPQREGPSKSVE